MNSPLPNERQEQYALHRANGMIPRKAAVAAGYGAASSIYSELEATPEVVQRYTYLTKIIQDRKNAQRSAAEEAAKMVGQITGVTRAWVIQQLALTAQCAREDKDYTESTHALELIGKEFGMFKGNNDKGDGSDVPQHLDLDKTEALLTSAEAPLELPTPQNAPPIDMELVEKLIQGNKPNKVKDRQLSTGSETDVALTDEVEIEEPEE